MYLIKNNTGFEIEVDNKTIQPGEEFETNDLPNTSEIIVYNDGDCNVFLSDGYKTHNNITVCEIYIG